MVPLGYALCYHSRTGSLQPCKKEKAACNGAIIPRPGVFIRYFISSRVPFHAFHSCAVSILFQLSLQPFIHSHLAPKLFFLLACLLCLSDSDSPRLSRLARLPSSTKTIIDPPAPPVPPRAASPVPAIPGHSALPSGLLLISVLMKLISAFARVIRCRLFLVTPQ